jgi:type II secretion system protein N
MSDDYKPAKLPDLPPLNDPGTSFGSTLGPSLSGSAPRPGASLTSGLMARGIGFDWRVLIRKFGRGAAWVAGLFVIFMISAWVSMPTRAIAWRISHEARKAGFIISVDDLSIRPWGSATLENVVWSFKPSRPDSTPVPFVIEELDVSFSVLKYLLLDTIDVEFEGTMDEGQIAGAYYKNDEESHIEFDISDLPLYGVPKLQEAVNAPVRGVFALNIDITAPGNEWAKSTGRLEVHCYSCTVGDGETKLFVPGSKKASMLSKGVTIPEIDLGTLDGVLEIADGKAVAEEFGTESNDIVFRISGDIEFDDPIENSRLNLLIKVFIDPSLRKRSDQVDLLVLTANPKVLMDPPDEGWMGIVLEGNLKNRRFRGIKSKSRQEALREKREASRAAAKQRAEQRAQQRAAQKAKQEEAKAAAEAAKAEEVGEEAGEAGEAGEAEAGEEAGEAVEVGERQIPPEAGVIIEEPPQEEPIPEEPPPEPPPEVQIEEERQREEEAEQAAQAAEEAQQYPQ